MALKRDWRGPLLLLLLLLLLLHRSRPHFIYTNFFSQLHWPGFHLHKLFWPLLCTRFYMYLHKLFLTTPVSPILSTQTFSRNSTAADSYYTNFFSQTPLPLLLLITQTYNLSASASSYRVHRNVSLRRENTSVTARNSIAVSLHHVTARLSNHITCQTPGKAYPAARLRILALATI